MALKKMARGTLLMLVVTARVVVTPPEAGRFLPINTRPGLAAQAKDTGP